MNVNTSLLFGAVALGELLSWVTVSWFIKKESVARVVSCVIISVAVLSI
jgi:hypothetical protein